MARPRNADGQRTRQAILDAALDLFAEKGYFGTSLRDVARAVGVRESALYNYFPGKEALFDALITAHQDSRLERLSAVIDQPGRDGRAVLERLAITSLEDFQEPRQEQLFRILMSDGIRLARAGRLNLVDRMGAGKSRLRELMRTLISSGLLRATDPETLVIAFMAPLVMWRQMHAIGADHAIVRNPRRFARQHVDQFLRGAAVEPIAPRPARLAPGRRATRRKPAPAASPAA